jgi:hypothetical protein
MTRATGDVAAQAVSRPQSQPPSSSATAAASTPVTLFAYRSGMVRLVTFVGDHLPAWTGVVVETAGMPGEED